MKTADESFRNEVVVFSADTIREALYEKGNLRLAGAKAVSGRVIITSKGGFPADGVLGTDLLSGINYALYVSAKRFYYSVE